MRISLILFFISLILFAQAKSMDKYWEKVVSKLVLETREEDGICSYLMIVPDDFWEAIQPLAEWKRELGYFVTVKKISEVGNNPTQIKNFIKSFYEREVPKLKYVLLAGAINKIPAFTIPNTPVVTDNTFACLVDEDYFPEVYIGRLPASNASELSVMVKKILSYEKEPYRADTLWYKRALAVATSYAGEGGGRAVSAIETKRQWRNLLLSKGFTKIDTVFWDLPPYPSSESIKSAVNRGILFVNGRGWGNYDGWHYPPFYREDVQSLNNANMLPVVTSLYCATANFNANPCFGEMWLRVGTVSNLKGAVLFFGPSWAATSTRWNNCLDAGIYGAIFNEHITTAAKVFLRGKIELIRNFPLPKDSKNLRIHFQTYNILGDPSLQIWRGVPKLLRIEPEHLSLRLGNQKITLRVKNLSGEGVGNARIAFVQNQEIKDVSYTDSLGFATVFLTLSTTDSVKLTVSAKDYLPYQEVLRVTRNNLSYYAHRTFDNFAGQRCSIYISLKNYQNQSANQVYALLSSLSNRAVVIDSIKSFGSIAPQEIKEAGPFIIEISLEQRNLNPLPFSLKITTSDSVFNSGFNLDFFSKILTCQGYRIIDGNNGIIEPGEEGDLIIRLKNNGNYYASQISGILKSASSAVLVLDSFSYYGDFAIGEEKENIDDQFRIKVLPNTARNRRLVFFLELYKNQLFFTRTKISFGTGLIDSSAPSSPSNYGYYAYEDIDIDYPQRPVFDWIEIDPNFGGGGVRIPLRNDDVKVLSFPPSFSFRFCGKEVNKISVSDNGFLILDSFLFRDFYNWEIFNSFVPEGLLACFWDDFHPDTLDASGVYYYYDQNAHRFILQWSRIYHIHGFIRPVLGEMQTFQVHLYDPRYYQTRTGDGIILFQYHTVFDDDSFHNYATVGVREFNINNLIKSGMEILFAQNYSKSFGVIKSGRAIKFTPEPPDTFIGINQKREAKSEKLKIPTITSFKTLLSALEKYYPNSEKVLYNPFGQRIAVRKNNLAKGVYFIKVLNKDGKILLKEKIVIINR